MPNDSSELKDEIGCYCSHIQYESWVNPIQGCPVGFMLGYNNCTVLPAVSFGVITVIILQLWEIPYRGSIWTNNRLSRHVGEISTYVMKEDMIWHVKMKLGPNFVEYLATSGL